MSQLCLGGELSNIFPYFNPEDTRHKGGNKMGVIRHLLPLIVEKMMILGLLT